MKPLFIVNLVLACLALISHGGLVVAQLFAAPGAFVSSWLLVPLVIGEVSLIVTSMTGILTTEARARYLLKYQSILFGIFGALVIGLLLRELPFGTTPGGGFWVPLVGSGFVAYCIYLLARAFPALTTMKPFQAALTAGALVLVIELAVVLA